MDIRFLIRSIATFNVFQCVHLLSVVTECPQNKASWELKSRPFHCPLPDMYHCVKSIEGELVEGCLRVVSLNNIQGCPVVVLTNTPPSIISMPCPVTNDIDCPEAYGGMYLSYKTYKYPSCILPPQTTERIVTTHWTESKPTANEKPYATSDSGVRFTEKKQTPGIQMDYDARRKITLMSGSIDIADSGTVVAIVVAVAVLILVFTGVFIFMRRRRKLNDETTRNIPYNYNTQTIESYDDVRGIGFSPRTRVISVSTDDIARSLEEEEGEERIPEGTHNETLNGGDDDDVFMTFEQLQSSRG